jgi:hypothetical protein
VTANNNSDGKDKLISVRVSGNERKRYRILAAMKDTDVSTVMRRGLSIWESLEGDLPPKSILRVLGIISKSAGNVRPVTGMFVQPPESVEWKPGDYCLLITSEAGVEIEALFRNLEGGERAVQSGDIIGLFRRDQEFENRIAHLKRPEKESAQGDGAGKVQLRMVTPLKGKNKVRLDPGAEVREEAEVRSEVGGVMLDCWQVS